MTKPAPKSLVDKLLSGVTRPGKRNVISDNAELARAIVDFLDLKEANADSVCGITLASFYLNQLRTVTGGPRTMDTVRSYVREILQRDHKTGKAL